MFKGKSRIQNCKNHIKQLIFFKARKKDCPRETLLPLFHGFVFPPVIDRNSKELQEQNHWVKAPWSV